MNKKLMSVASAGVLALGCLSANANSISVGAVSTALDGSGGLIWTYPMIFDNSRVDNTQPSFFNINDFGPIRAGSLLGPATGWSLTVPGTTVSFSQPLTGDNSGTLIPDNPLVADFEIKFSNIANITSGTYNLVLDTALNSTGLLANYSSRDVVSGGLLAGQTSQVQSIVLSPAGIAIPDGGMTAMLLGGALSALGLIRRKLA